MRHRLVVLSALALLLVGFTLAGSASADPFAVVRYQVFHWETDAWVEYVPGDAFPAGGDQPGTNEWRYDYIVYNWGTPQPIQQVYLFFNSDNLAMDATWTGDAVPAGWTGTQIGPFEPDYNWKERFMASGPAYYIAALDSLAGFSIEFTWIKPVLPGNQVYDAVFSGGSESGLTLHKTAPIAARPSSWGDIKRLYR
jgi:hypothetical protein